MQRAFAPREVSEEPVQSSALFHIFRSCSYKTSEEPPDMETGITCARFPTRSKIMPCIRSSEEQTIPSDIIHPYARLRSLFKSPSQFTRTEFRPRRHFSSVLRRAFRHFGPGNSPSLMATAAKAPSKSPVSSLEKVDFLT